MTEHDDLQYAKTLITMITIATMTMMTMINIVRMAWFCRQIQSAVETTDQNQGTLKCMDTYWIRLSLANEMQTSKQKQQFFHSPLLSSYPSSFAQLPPPPVSPSYLPPLWHDAFWDVPLKAPGALGQSLGSPAPGTSENLGRLGKSFFELVSRKKDFKLKTEWIMS